MGSALASIPFFYPIGTSLLPRSRAAFPSVTCFGVSLSRFLFRASIGALFSAGSGYILGRSGPQQSASASVTPSSPRETFSTAPSLWRSPGPASLRQRGRWGAWCQFGPHHVQRRAWGRHERCAGELGWGRSRFQNSMRPLLPPPTGACAAATHDTLSATRWPGVGAIPGRLDQAVGATRVPY